jgi:hypothetical protein
MEENVEIHGLRSRLVEELGELRQHRVSYEVVDSRVVTNA